MQHPGPAQESRRPRGRHASTSRCRHLTQLPLPQDVIDPGALAWAADGPPVLVPPPLLVTALLPNGGVPDRRRPPSGQKLRRLGVNVGLGGPPPFDDYLSG